MHARSPSTVTRCAVSPMLLLGGTSRHTSCAAAPSHLPRLLQRPAQHVPPWLYDVCCLLFTASTVRSALHARLTSRPECVIPATGNGCSAITLV